jgi:hypothetical protein
MPYFTTVILITNYSYSCAKINKQIASNLGFACTAEIHTRNITNSALIPINVYNISHII